MRFVNAHIYNSNKRFFKMSVLKPTQRFYSLLGCLMNHVTVDIKKHRYTGIFIPTFKWWQ